MSMLLKVQCKHCLNIWYNGCCGPHRCMGCGKDNSYVPIDDTTGEIGYDRPFLDMVTKEVKIIKREE